MGPRGIPRDEVRPGGATRPQGQDLEPDHRSGRLRVIASASAREVVRRVAASGRTELTMVLGTGCCDSTAPFLYDHHLLQPDAVRVGEVGSVPVFVHAWLAKLYEGDRTLVIDVDEGLVNDSLSLESDLDCRFTLQVPDQARV